MRTLLRFVCGTFLLSLGSCAVGPNYHRPPVADLTPTDWHWKIAQPSDSAPKGHWWEVFNDPILNELEAQAETNSQTLRAAVARVDEARATARISRSRFFPDISLDPSMKRERTSGHLPTPIPFPVPSAYINTFSVPFDLSYEIDLWGRVRRSFEAARAEAQASVADQQNVRLTLSADVAANYFLVRSLDLELTRLRRTIELYDRSVAILSERFAAGAIPEIDVAQARTEAATARVQLADISRQRAETVHALALLCGKPASSFDIEGRPMPTTAGVVPAGLPSSLLERRPDIARAERALADKNAQIGVARAAYFPALRLTGQAGYLSAEADTLFASDSRVWSIGPSVSFPLFTGGRTTAQVRQAEAAYQEALADYRQAVLSAFKEVEDSLAQITLRNEQSVAQAEALTSARRVVELANVRYEAGTVNYLEVIDAERRLLEQERQDAQLQGQRLVASVHLIKALGGSWEQP
jgi:multidrug efflux system outer membrane protein